MPGSPYLYYGEEIGMKGMKPDEHIREPFIWGEGKSDPGQASWIEPKFSTSQSVDPLSEQLNDPSSMYNHYKSLIELRNGSKVLSTGGIANTNINDNELITFYRYADGDTLTIIHNLSGADKTLEADGDLVYGHQSKAQEDQYVVGAYGSLVLR